MDKLVFNQVLLGSCSLLVVGMKEIRVVEFNVKVVEYFLVLCFSFEYAPSLFEQLHFRLFRITLLKSVALSLVLRTAW